MVADIYRKLMVDIEDGTLLSTSVREDFDAAVDLSNFHTQAGCMACDPPVSSKSFHSGILELTRFQVSYMSSEILCGWELWTSSAETSNERPAVTAIF